MYNRYSENQDYSACLKELKKEAKELGVKTVEEKYGEYMVKADPQKYNYRVVGAKNIRKELKKAFPKVKFSVRGESYSMGDSITVSWTDGPLTKDVDEYLGKYNRSSYDAIEDYHGVNRTPFNQTFGGADHVFSNRSLSGEKYAQVAKELFDVEVVVDKYKGIEGLDYEKTQEVYQTARNRAYA